MIKKNKQYRSNLISNCRIESYVTPYDVFLEFDVIVST